MSGSLTSPARAFGVEVRAVNRHGQPLRRHELRRAGNITGPFLAHVGASAFVTGAVAGVGEFVGYALRIVFGYLSGRTGRYWPITLWG